MTFLAFWGAVEDAASGWIADKTGRGRSGAEGKLL